MLVFSDAPGRVSRLTLKDTSRVAAIEMDGFTFDALHVVISQFGLALKPNFQTSDTLGDDITLLTFGESLSPATLHGQILSGVCDTSDTDIDANDGVRETIEWWSKNNLTKLEEPANIVLEGGYTIQVFISDLNISAMDPELGTWKFAMSLLRIPEITPVSDDLAGFTYPEANNIGSGNTAPATNITSVNPAADTVPQRAQIARPADTTGMPQRAQITVVNLTPPTNEVIDGEIFGTMAAQQLGASSVNSPNTIPDFSNNWRSQPRQMINSEFDQSVRPRTQLPR